MNKEQNNIVNFHTRYLGPMARVLGNPDRKPGPMTLDDIKTAVKSEVAEMSWLMSDAEMEHVIEATLFQLAHGVTQANGADLGYLGRFESITHEIANTYTYHPFGDPDDAA